MALTLRTQLPEAISSRYWQHNSAGEHVDKHIGEIQEINDIRVRRGEVPFGNEQMYGWMEVAGVAAVHILLPEGGVGPTVGYVVSERNSRAGVLDVKDFYVLEEHRRKGIGGFLLGKLIADMTPHNTRLYGGTARQYGAVLNIGGVSYALPGMVRTVYEDVTGAEWVAGLRNLLAEKKWNGILQVIGNGPEENILMVGGEPQATFERLEMNDEDEWPQYVISGGGSVRYADPAFAAIAVLNRDKLMHGA